MHLRKMQISFYQKTKFIFASKEDKNQFFDFEKDVMTSRFLKLKKKKDHNNKGIKNIFQQKKY